VLKECCFESKKQLILTLRQRPEREGAQMVMLFHLSQGSRLN
jgi:hypothetical protein